MKKDPDHNSTDPAEIEVGCATPGYRRRLLSGVMTTTGHNNQSKFSSAIGDFMGIVKLLTCLLGLFLAVASTDNQRDSTSLNTSRSVRLSTPEPAQTILDENSIKNTIGVITLNDKQESDSKDIVQIYNQDGGLWYEFSFDDDSDRKFDGSNLDFRPFAFHQDYYLIVLKCVGADASRYEVIVNESTGLRKYVRKNDRTFMFQTWEDHILHLTFVGFDQATNPLMNAPTLRGRRVRAPKDITDVFFQPVKIEGNW